MVTYPDLIQIGILILGILSLYMQAKKKWPLCPVKTSDHFKRQGGG